MTTFTHNAGLIFIDDQPDLIDAARWTHGLWIEEFHQALKHRHVTRERRHDLAVMVDDLNKVFDARDEWRRANEGVRT